MIIIPSPALIVALKAEPSVYTWMMSVGYEAMVSSAEAFKAAGFDFLFDPSRSLVWMTGSFKGRDGGKVVETLSIGCLGSG